MGNEASMEGGEAGVLLSAPPASGQLVKPVNGAAAGAGRTLEPSGGVNRLAGGTGPPSSPMQGSANPYKKVIHDGPRHSQTSSTHQSQIQTSSGGMAANQSPGQHASRRNLQVDFKTCSGRTGRSPTVSPDRASAPTSPYSVPQIAPMPSSKLCPICNTAELTSVDGSPNFNKCTQCHSTVCNQCGFNPNPHLAGVKEWLCLNCQMQRALGIDMTTPRSKSQQQIHSPSHQPKPEPIPKTQLSAQPASTSTTQQQSQMQTQTKIQPQAQSQSSSGIQRQFGPTVPDQTRLHSAPQTQKEAQTGLQSMSRDPLRQHGEIFGPKSPERGVNLGKPPHPGAVPLPGLVKAQSQSDLGRGSPVRYGGQPEKTRSAGSSPARQPLSQDAPPQDGLTKLFGFGASLLNQASTLISADPLSGSSHQPSAVRNQSAQGSRVIFNDANAGARTAAPGTAKTSPGGVVLSKGPETPLEKQSALQQLPVHHQKEPKQPQFSTPHQKTALEQQPLSVKQAQPVKQKPDITCPLCKTAFNVGTTEPPNYKSCTQCHTQVCNLCGFNPTPHLLEKKEWLCLNCQTQRLMSGGLDPLPVSHSSPNHQPVGSPKHQQLSSQQQQGSKAMSPLKKPSGSQQSDLTAPMARPGSVIKTSLPTDATAATTFIGEEQRKETAPKLDKESDLYSTSTEKAKITEPIQSPARDDKKELQRSRYYDETSKINSNQDLSRSPQSLSDTGYSSDGISSSHSEITGLIQEEELKLNERGLTGHHTPPSPSEMIKLESSMRPLLEFKVSSEGEGTNDSKREKDHHGDIRKHRSRSISISPEEYDSDEDFEGIMEVEEEPTDWETKRELRSISALGGHKKRNLESEEITDEEFMRRQIMEMSADDEDDVEEEEDNEDEDYSYKKPKKTQKHISDSGKEKHRLTYQSSSFEEESKTTSDVYKGSAEEDLMASQGGLRRFKTIELNNSNSYSRDIELNNDNDLSLDREPELEMESLTGSPEERSRGEYSSTLPPTTSSYTSGISPTSISSMEDDSDSSPSRRQRLEEAKQQRKARHRSHGPLLPTIEDSSEEDELREEEELLREQEKMREVEQQRIRSTVRKTKRDKEELRAQRRRERSKTPPSNLSPIEDASPTEELRQAAEMEELHRSSCSEYSPSADSDTEGYEMQPKLYKSGSEYNLPTFMSLYSPTEKPQTTSSTAMITTTSSSKQLKSAEEVYEEMMRKAEMLQKQQQQQQQQSCSGQQYNTSSYQESDIRNRQEYEDEYDYTDQDDILYEDENTVDIYEEIRQTSQNISKQLDDKIEMDDSYSEKQLLDTGSAFAKLLEQSNALLTPGTSPTQISAPVSFSETVTGGRIPDVKVTQHFSKDGNKDRLRYQTGKNGITPAAAATNIAAYGVFTRDTVTVSQTRTSQTVSTTQPNLYGRQTGSTTMTTNSASDMSHKIAEITQAYNQSAVRKVSVSKGVQMRDNSTSSESGTVSVRGYMYHERSPPLSPTSSHIHSPTQSQSKRTSELSTQTFSPSMLASSANVYHTSPVLTQSTQTSQRIALPCLFQKSSPNSSFMMRTEEFEATSPPKPVKVNTATSPLSSPTRFSRQSTFDDYSPPDSPPDIPPHQQLPHRGFYRSYKPGKVNVGTSMVTTTSMYTYGSLSMDNISLCHISTVPGTSRIEQGQRLHSGSVVDLRTAMKPMPVIMTDQGMDLTSFSTESHKYSGSTEGSPIRQSTTIQPLVMNLNTQEQLHVVTSTATTVSVTVAASMFMSQPKQPVLYCDPLENRVDFGKGMGPVVCLALNKQPPTDPSIPKIDAKLEDLSIQQQQLFIQQQKLQHQQQILEEQLQHHHQLQQQAASFAKLDLTSRLPAFKKDMVVTQTSTAIEVNAISPDMTSDVYGLGGPSELREKQQENLNLTNVKPHSMMVQMDGLAQGPAITHLVKSEDIQDAVGLSSQMKSENQVTCCDMVYNLPFGGSCVGVPFSQKQVIDDITKESTTIPSIQTPLYQQLDLFRDQQTFQNCAIKSHTLPLPRRLQPSMSETNIAEAGFLSYSAKLDPHFQSSGELFTDIFKDGYEREYTGMGLQYGSYTDLRQGDVSALPIRRYSSLTNISTDCGYFPGDFAESNLAQYSATTAREISRMCAALNSMDRYSSNPDILLATGRCSGPPIKVNVLQAPRHSFKYSPDGKPLSHSQTLTDLINARQASLRAMYPSAIRSVDGMIYSTINTPIASTVPITTQPASVLRPLLRGVYRPYPTPNMTPVPLASLTRLPVAPRTGQVPFQYPTPNILSVTTAKESLSIITAQDTPLFLGKSPVSLSVTNTVAQPIQPSCVPACSTTPAPISTKMTVPMGQTDMQVLPLNLSLPHLQSIAQPLIQHQQPQAKPPIHSFPPVHGHTSAQSKTQLSPSTQRGTSTSTTTVPESFFPNQEKETEEKLHQQQEQVLQLERERVELEKMRQLRLQEELERERAELQRDREKEQMLVQREIQELQTIKQQVLKQQQAERENQLLLQREQLAQQKKQLDQIQSLQQQLQQQLEEQKSQKSATSAVATNTNTQHPRGKAGKINQPQEFVPDVLYSDVQVFLRPLPNSASEMCLRKNDDQTEIRSMRKQRSMPRLQDGNEGEITMFPQRVVNTCVQTDDEDREERYLVSRRRRTRRSVDCSVQTDDDEDQAEWEQPVRRRRNRYSRHVGESGVDHKPEMPSFATSATKATSSSIAIQTIRDCSCQTETDQLVRVSPSIHVTMPDPNKVEIVHYISGPERTPKGQSISCQTDPETQPQSIVVPQISIATTVCPTSVQLVGSADQLSPHQQSVVMLGRRRPDPLEFGYQQHHLHNESLSSLIRQQPKSPQVLYSPVSPLSSPQHVIETSFSSSEKLNKAHVTPQKKSSIGELPQRHQALPRPMKNIQRSMSDPKPLSPTTDENAKARMSFYQQQALQSQLAALQQSSLLRKVKRTLPSPPPEETLPMVAPNLSQMFMPSLSSFKGGSRLAAKTSLLKDLTHELKAVEQESTKLRKQQAELEEEEKEIDAKLRYLELGITQRKETLVKERERRELAYIRCMGDSRDYMSDSELNNLRLTSAATSFEGNGILTRPSTAPLSQFTCELNTAAQFPPTSSFMSYQYPQSLLTAPTPQASTLPSTGFNQPPYPSVTQAQAFPQPTPLQTYPTLSYQVQGTFPSQGFPLSQPPYPTDTLMPHPTQPSHPGFQPTLPPACGTTYPSHSTPYPSQAPPYPVSQTSTYQPQADTLTFQQKPRQTSLADLEHKMPTNYEIVSNPTVTITAQDTSYSQSGLGPPYGQYSTAVSSTYGPYSSVSASSAYGPYTTTSSSSYGQYTTTIANTYGYTVTTASSYGQYSTAATNTYGQAVISDHMHSMDSPSVYSSEGMYGSSNLEQNVSRNYVLIDDICELTKEGMGTAPDSHRSEGHGRYGTDGLHTRGGSSCGRPEDERDADLYDQHHGRGKSTGSYQAQGTNTHSRVVGSSSMGGGSLYYYDDYRNSAPTRAAHRHKYLCPPAVMSSRRSKHRKQSIEQKISKFSPIEEAHDVEADLASYTMSTSTTSGYGSGSQYHKLQDDVNGLRSAYSQQWGNYNDEHLYGYGRSRSAGYGMDKISSCEKRYSSRSYEGGSKNRSYHSNHGQTVHPSSHSQYSEKGSSHLMTKLMGVGRAFNYPSNSYGSSHSLPDVQDHIRDLPRTHVYEPDDMYIIDDMHCAVSDSEAYHLGQEETDWFEKPREVRSSRHYGSNGHSGRRGHVKHTYHDYDEPPEDLWPQNDYGHTRHMSSREYRHHGSGSSGRHSSRHSDEPRSSRSSRSSKDPSMRNDSRSLSSSGRRGESRSQGYHSSDYSRDPSGQHHSSRSGKQSSHHQGSSSRKQQEHISSSRQPGTVGPTQKGPGGPSSSSRQPGSQPAIDGQQGQRTQLPQSAQTSATRPGLQTSSTGSTQPQLVQAQQLQSKPVQPGPMARQPTPAAQTTSAATKPEPVTAIGAKAAQIQPGKTAQPPLTGIGSKAVPRPAGIGSAAAGQPGVEGESVLSKILPGGAAEQAGKLGEAITGFGKKFSSLW